MNEIKVYYTYSVLSFAPRLAEYQAVLDKNELATAECFKLPKLRQRYIISHGFLRRLLAEFLNERAENIRIERTEFGKPFLPDDPELSFNISHSDDILAIAISSRCLLGIDVECYKTRNSWKHLVKKCFAPEEKAYWYRLSNAEHSRAFYEFWVKKEAFVKAVGTGITLGLNKCVINPDKLNSFLRVPESVGSASRWQIYSLSLAENQFGAVVCDRQDTVLQLQSIS